MARPVGEGEVVPAAVRRVVRSAGRRGACIRRRCGAPGLPSRSPYLARRSGSTPVPGRRRADQAAAAGQLQVDRQPHLVGAFADEGLAVGAGLDLAKAADSTAGFGPWR